MATFAEAIAKTLLFEGGYVNDRADSGGETYRGISRVNWPKWDGWKSIDRWKETRFSYDIAFPSCLDNDSNLQGLVCKFYLKNFWFYDGLLDQDLANQVFDLSVNVGRVHAIKILQQVVGTNQDGSYGPNTERLANGHPQGSLEPLVRTAAENYHKAIITSHPEDAKFLKGWLARDDG